MYHAVKTCLLASLTLAILPLSAVDVTTLRVTTPFTMHSPIRTDSTDVMCKPFNEENLLMESPISPQLWKQGEPIQDGILAAPEQDAIRLAGFQVECNLYAKCDIKVEGVGIHKVFIDGQEGTQRDLLPGRHDVVVKLLQKAGKADTLKVSLESQQDKYLTINPDGKRLYTLEDYMHGQRAGATNLSSTGRYMVLNTSITRTDGKTDHNKTMYDLQTGREIAMQDFFQWASTGDRYIRQRTASDMATVYEYVDPATGTVEPLLTDYTHSNGTFLPGEKLMIVYQNTEGPKEDAEVHQILEPDDRIPGWRNRNNIQLMNVQTGQVVQLTQGQHNVYSSTSEDGTKVALMVAENCMTERPFTFYSVLLVDLPTMKVDTLVRRDGFIGQVQFMPDGNSLIFSGSPEAFGGIGKNDPTGKIPSMIQTELFQMDLQTRQVKSLTYDLNPNVEKFECNPADGNIYALCENRDRHDLFCLDMKHGKWNQLKLSECYVNSFSLAREKPLLSYTGQSDSNSDRVYTVDLKSGKEKLFLDYDQDRMGDIQLGKCEDWNFQSSRGDTICGRYYLPPHFDETKKYPMLVYYYGGCSPTGRYLDSYYNFHGWAAMGYVVYVIQPSGCTGFGQEFAARHVNTYGDYTADDIIQGTKQFCVEHPYVNPKKIGCLGASYGGFMTMYLQTQTDIFAAAMAHAGISNPTSYWGYGYWGYSYSTTSAANSYPWNNSELLNGHAPLMHADKIHTPLLFLHGGSDTNVPINESIQLFNALKILGRPCAFVKVEDQDHHILDYNKRIKWVHTFYAWFAKWLQDDDTWWESMYPEKNLK